MVWYKVQSNIVDFTVTNYKNLDVIEACQSTVNNILINYPAPYHIMISGGIDSQAMLYAWNLYGKDFIPTTVIYNEKFNLHDIEHIENFTKGKDFKINYLKFDLLSFLQNEYDTYSEEFRCSSPCISAYIKMTENLNGTVIFAGDFLSQNGARLTDAILGLYRASLIRKNLIPYFFLHTPELAYSFLKSIKKIDYYKLSDYNKKVFLYQENGIPVIPQKTKISGFEKVKDYYDEHYYDLIPKLHRLKYANKPSKRTFDLLYRYPYEEKYNDKEYKFITNQ